MASPQQGLAFFDRHMLTYLYEKGILSAFGLQEGHLLQEGAFQQPSLCCTPGRIQCPHKPDQASQQLPSGQKGKRPAQNHRHIQGRMGGFQEEKHRKTEKARRNRKRRKGDAVRTARHGIHDCGMPQMQQHLRHPIHMQVQVLPFLRKEIQGHDLGIGQGKAL